MKPNTITRRAFALSTIAALALSSINSVLAAEAQLGVPLRPEFKGTVATVETRDFWRSQEPFGGNNQGIHWNGNGESYWLMGDAMGQAMVKMMKGN